MNKHDWNPDLYLKFDKERILPTVDLVGRIDCENPKDIIDIGCGPGNSTQILFNRWPDSNIVGADKSPAMIKKASDDYPDQKWILYDASHDNIDNKFDIVFSNATIQWIPNHKKLIKRFADLLIDKGILAVQLPLFLDMPIGKSITEIAKQNRWKSVTRGVDDLFEINSASYYYNQLSPYFSHINIWITDYFHVMDSHLSILEMMRSTGLKPYKERINETIYREEFEKQVLESIKRDYPLQNNGKVIFPFKRLFFVAKK